jgi:hypothetical protein
VINPRAMASRMDRGRHGLAVGAYIVDLLVPLLVILPLLWALLPDGIPLTADGRVHLIRSAEIVDAWREGLLLPRWSANLGVGLGIPLFLYSPPLPYLLTAGFHWLAAPFGLSLDLAMKGISFLAVYLLSAGAYRLARDTVGRWPGAVCATAVVYAPIVLRELFIQGNLPQLLGWAVAPWCFWAVLRIFAGTRRWGAVWLALALAAVVLSHNAAALLMAGLLTVQVGVLMALTCDVRAVGAAAAGAVVGLLLSSWFWPAAFWERNFVQIDRIQASDFHNRFVDIGELVALAPRLDAAAINPYYPLTLGAVQVALGLVGMVALVALVAQYVRGGSDGSRQTPGAAGAAQRELSPGSFRYLLGASLFFAWLACFGASMALPWSAPVWERMPFMNLFEFPFRWHGFTALGLGWLGALAIFVVQRRTSWPAPAMATGAVALLLGSAIVNLYPDKMPPGAWATTPQAAVRYEVTAEAVGTTSLGEFTPIWATTSLFRTSPFAAAYPAEGHAVRLPATVAGRQVAFGVEDLRFTLLPAASQTVTFALLYFPGWQALVDGVAAPVAPEPGTGLLQVQVPAQTSQLVLRYAGTPSRRTGEIVALAAWIGLLATVIWWGRNDLRGIAEAGEELAAGARDGNRAADGRRLRAIGEQRPAGERGGRLLGVMLLVAAAAIVLRDGFPHWFRVNSSPDHPLPAAQVLQIDYGDSIRVVGVDPPPAHVAPGETLNVTVYLRALQPLGVDYGLRLELVQAGGPPVASVAVRHPSEMPTRGWPPGLYVRVPLALTVPADALPIRHDLRLSLADPASEQSLLTTDGDSAATIAQVWVDGKPAGVVPAGLRAQFGGQIALLGADYRPEAQQLLLHWRAEQPADRDLSVFVHWLDANGNRLGQSDGAPCANRCLTSAWTPGAIIEDWRVLPAGVDPAAVRAVAIGLYDPADGVRLAATGADGTALNNGAFVLDLAGPAAE